MKKGKIICGVLLLFCVNTIFSQNMVHVSLDKHEWLHHKKRDRKKEYFNPNTPEYVPILNKIDLRNKKFRIIITHLDTETAQNEIYIPKIVGDNFKMPKLDSSKLYSLVFLYKKFGFALTEKGKLLNSIVGLKYGIYKVGYTFPKKPFERSKPDKKISIVEVCRLGTCAVTIYDSWHKLKANRWYIKKQLKRLNKMILNKQ